MSNESYQEIEKILSADSDFSLSNDPNALRMKLARIINNLIHRDFASLVNILYRIDVNEAKLKDLLKKHPDEDAGHLIANLIIERQQQKVESRRGFDNNAPADADEKW